MANRCLAHLQTSQVQQCLEDVPTPRVRINAANLRVRMCSHVDLIYIYIYININIYIYNYIVSIYIYVYK